DVNPQLERDTGVGGRKRGRDRLSAADQRGGPTRGGAGYGQRQPLRRQIVVLQSEVNRRVGSGSQRDRRIVCQEEQTLDVVLLLFGCCRHGPGKSQKGNRYQGDNATSHSTHSRQKAV